MSVEVFPLVPDNAVNKKKSFHTLITTGESGREQRRAKWGVPLREIELVFRNRTKTEAETLEDFFDSREGAYDSFYYKPLEEKAQGATYIIENESVHSSYADEDTSQISIYPIDASNFVLYDDGVAIDGADYTLNATTGVVTWITKPATTSVITASYDYYIPVRFDDDDLDIQRLRIGIYNMKIVLKEVRT